MASPCPANPGGRPSAVFTPEFRYYNKSPNKPNSEVDFRSDLREDMYLAMTSWRTDMSGFTIKASIHPLINWIWIGGIVLAAGALICLLPGPAGPPKRRGPPVPVDELPPVEIA